MSEDFNWHVVTIAKNGTVNFIRNLTREQAERLVAWLRDPEGRHAAAKAEAQERAKRAGLAGFSYGMVGTNEGWWIERIEILGPMP